jgi:hypothetical protein
MHSLRRFLVDYDMAMLRAVAETRGVRLDTNVQAEAADRLAAALVDPLSVRVALAHLSPGALAALQALAAAGGRLRAPQFARAHGQIRPVGPGRLEREALWQKPDSPAEELWYAGLIGRAFAEDRGGPGEFFFLPDELLPFLPQPEPGQPAFSLTTVPPPADPGAEELSLVHDLFYYLVYLHGHDVRPYADGRLGRRDTAALQERMAGAAQRRLALVHHLAARLGLAVRQGDLLRLEGAAVRGWLAAAPAQQLAALHGAWRADPTWIDLCQVPGLRCDDAGGWLARYDAVAVRAALLDLLARCPPDAWWTVDSFVAAVKETHPDFQRPDGDYGSWYIREADAERGEYLSGFDSWDAVEGRLIRDLLAGVLSWLRVVRLAPGGVCRLAGEGLRLLGLTAPPAEDAPPKPIVVRPDFSVEVPRPGDLYSRFQLERFADLKGEAPCLYRLSAASLGRALGRNVQVEQILAFLNQATGGSLPANVAGQLRLWAGRFGQVELKEMVLLSTRSEQALKELAVLPETRAYLTRQLSPVTALVRKEDLPALRRALQALGFLPPGEEPGDAPQPDHPLQSG